ncbi:MAG: cysteine hydrolase family protein [Ilumatobacteraceae bacterium]
MTTQARTLEIAARPSPLQFGTDRTAVVVVDMQNDFASPGGMFDRAGIDVRGIQAIVAPTAALLDVARAAGMLVVYLKMGFHPDLSDSGAPNSPTWLKHIPFQLGADVIAPDGTPSRILVRDTWNTDIVDDLRPHDDDVVLYKNRYSGFYATGLDEQLRARGIETLIVVGATTSVCVESTVRDATFRDYRCLVVEDCVAEPIASDAPRTNQEASLTVLELLFAWITDSAALYQALRLTSSSLSR